MKFAMEGDDGGGSAEQRVDIVWLPNCETEEDDNDNDDESSISVNRNIFVFNS